MTLQNSGTVDNFTVTLAKGDILNTPKPVVERIWHVKEGTSGGSKATMKLFFFKQDVTKYGISQDEVESGFNYGDIHLIHKLGNLFQNNSNLGDIKSNIGNSFGSELYGLYTTGVSKDNNGVANGINLFSPFSVVNANGIILPLTFINLKAYQSGSIVKVDWTSLTETNVIYYGMQRSANAVDFKIIGTLPATGNGTLRKDYTLPDLKPLQGKNYYRIKAVDKDGKTTYSNIALVNISNGRSGITVSPNPIHGKQATVQFTNMEEGSYTVILYDLTGKKLFQQKLIHLGWFSRISIIVASKYCKRDVPYYHS